MAQPAPRFTHLHLHTEYSLLDGGNKIEPLLARVKELGMDAVAVTDHGNLYGAIEFYRAAKAAGVKPILGIEAYVAPGDRTDRRSTGIADGGFHLVLLAENNTGWGNLLKLSSDSFLNGFYYKPRMDKSTLTRWNEGLIAINGHLGSSIAHHLLQHVQTGSEAHYQAALEEARWHARTFGPNERGEPRFFIELQMHDVEQQRRINPHLVRLARELDLPLVADNDAHFLRAEDYLDHDSLCCISMGKTKDDPSRLHYSRELYVKSPEQMAALLADVPEAMENTVRIAERCDVHIDFTANHAPVVKVGRAPESDVPSSGTDGGEGAAARGTTEWFVRFCSQFRIEPFDQSVEGHLTSAALKEQCDEALRALCLAGLEWRYGERGATDAIRRRLERELEILAAKNISAYFLIVWDVVNWARQQNIPASARGSGVGTMVGYVLGLSNACPERYGLLFERFTDPDRSEYPDIDIDICQDGRADVINYVRQKYGHVAQIITFGRLKAKAAIKDVARVNGLTPAEGQRLANLVPDELNITLDAALEKEPDFRAEYDQNPTVRSIIDTARALEGHARHAGVHAAGVVVATQPLENIIPLGRATGSEDVVTQWDGPTCEKLGLLKMDFLGLRTLSTIELARTLIRRTLPEERLWEAVGCRTGAPPEGDSAGPHAAPHPLDLERLHYDDQRVFDLFRRAETSGVFQFESGGMRKLLAEMQPDRIEDLIAANALFRPGPMDLIHEYCLRKHGKQPVPRVHPIVDGFTAETYGIMVYQEQVMQIVHGLGDIPLRRAYSLIKAISKKRHDVVDAERPRFIQGAVAKGLSHAQADDLFDLILKFAGYGFNKSHSTGYAIIAYQTAYLKTYFPMQYMAAVLTYESAAKKVEDWVPYLEDCRHTRLPDHEEGRPHVGIEVKPPDLNRSAAEFSVVFDDSEPRDASHGHVRFGLSAIKGVGRAAIRSIIEARDAGGPFTSLHDLCERLAGRSVNKATIEALVKCGAFDSLHGAEHRAAALAAIDEAIKAGQSLAEDRASGQMNFFLSGQAADAPAPRAERPLPPVPPWDRITMLRAEKETLGFHVSGHPLDEYEAILRAYCTASCRAAAEAPDETPVVLGGVLSRVRPTPVRHGPSAGQKMAMIEVVDKTGSIGGVAFSDVFATCGHLLQVEAIVLLVGRVDRSRGEPQIILEEVLRAAEAPCHLASRLELVIRDDPKGEPVQPIIEMVAGLLQQAHGGAAGRPGRPVEVDLHLHTGGQRVTLRPSRVRVIPEPGLLDRLTDLLGPDGVHVRPGRPTWRARSGGSRGGRRSRAPAPATAPAGA